MSYYKDYEGSYKMWTTCEVCSLSRKPTLVPCTFCILFNHATIYCFIPIAHDYTQSEKINWHIDNPHRDQAWYLCVECLSRALSMGAPDYMVEFRDWVNLRANGVVDPADLVHPNPYIREEAQRVHTRAD